MSAAESELPIDHHQDFLIRINLNGISENSTSQNDISKNDTSKSDISERIISTGQLTQLRSVENILSTYSLPEALWPHLGNQWEDYAKPIPIIINRLLWFSLIEFMRLAHDKVFLSIFHHLIVTETAPTEVTPSVAILSEDYDTGLFPNFSG